MNNSSLPVAIPITDNPSQEAAYGNIPIAENIEIIYDNSSIPIANSNNNNNIPVSQAIPMINNDNLEEFVTNLQDDIITTNMAIAWRLAKTIRFFTIIDIILCIFTIMINPISILIASLPIMGYFGAKYYNYYMVAMYGLFIVINLTFRIYDYMDLTTQSLLLLCIIYILIELVILKLIYTFIKYLHHWKFKMPTINNSS